MVWSCEMNSVVPSGAARLERLRGDLAAGARAVLDDDVGAQLVLELLGQRARDRVGAAAGRKADEDAHGLAGLGRRRADGERQAGERNGQDSAQRSEPGWCEHR